MNNGISFKFNFETDNHQEAHDMMPVIMEKLRELHDQNMNFRYMELNLLKPAPDRKTACLTVYNQDGVIREESRDEDWEHAIEAVFGHVTAGSQTSLKMH